MSLGNGTVSTLAGNGHSGFTNGNGSLALFNGPQHLVISPNGDAIYVADGNNNAVRIISCSSGYILYGGACIVQTSATIHPSVQPTIQPTNSTASVKYMNNIVVKTFLPKSTFNYSHPVLGITLDYYESSLYFTETGLNIFRKIVINSGIITTLSYNGNIFL